MDPEKFNSKLYADIPLARQIGVRAVEISDTRVVLQAPLAPNTNPNSSAFGGSVYSVAVLSCWALISENATASGYAVIQDGRIEYEVPVTGDFTAESSWSSDRGKFLNTLKRRGLARATLESVVKCKGRVCAKLTARFVIK